MFWPSKHEFFVKFMLNGLAFFAKFAPQLLNSAKHIAFVLFVQLASVIAFNNKIL